MGRYFLLAAVAMLSACTTPADVSMPLSAGGDKNAKFQIVDTPSGFTIDLTYSRYQFVPEGDALIAACKSIVINRANEEAELRRREVKPIDGDAIRVSTGRNILSARTACRAFVEVNYQ